MGLLNQNMMKVLLLLTRLMDILTKKERPLHYLSRAASKYHASQKKFSNSLWNLGISVLNNTMLNQNELE